MDDINDFAAPQTIDTMTAALYNARSVKRRAIILGALVAGPGTQAWTDAEVELASQEAS